MKGIIREFELRRERCSVLAEGRRFLETVYVGGGTPSLLEPELMAQLLTGTSERLSAGSPLEVTAEANPESFTPELARAWRMAGINRVSLGIQSLDAGLLAVLDRRCDAATARRALQLACREFDRVAADWILGPRTDGRRLLEELREVTEAGVGHISLYLLELHPGTPLAKAVAAGRVELFPQRELVALYLEAVALLAVQGLDQYEVASFARPGHQSRHNRRYWQRVPYLGLGPAAHGFYGNRRYANIADLDQYLRAIEAGRLPEQEVDHLTRAARRLEAVILPLRTAAGVPLARLPAEALPLARGEREGLWRIEAGCLRLTARGYLQIDSVEATVARALAASSRPLVEQTGRADQAG